MTMKFAKFAFPLMSLSTALVAGAKTQDLNGILGLIDTIFSAIVPILLTLALIYFMWGLVKYIMSAGDEKARGDGKYMMIWGIIALFVMVAVWGLVASLGKIIGIESETAPTNQIINNVPVIPTPDDE